MGTTGTYNLPYPEATDAPDGPAQILALAEAVEDEIVRVDSDIAALSPASGGDAEAGSYTVTSTTYTTAASGGTYADCATTFVAPPSGAVLLLYSGQLNNSGSNSTRIAPEVRTGATIGSGTIVLAAADANSALISGGVDAAYSRHRRLTGLAPGSTYNARILHRVSGGTGTILNRQIDVIPLLG